MEIKQRVTAQYYSENVSSSQILSQPNHKLSYLITISQRAFGEEKTKYHAGRNLSLASKQLDG